MRGTLVVSVFVKPLVYLLSFLAPRRDDVWVFTTDESGRFAENTKYLFLHVNETREGIRPVWIAGDGQTVTRLQENGYEAYRRDSWRARYLVLRSEFVFLSHSLSFWEYTGGATVIQLWHGNALKTLGRDNESEPSLLLRLFRKVVGKNWDAFAVTNRGTPRLPFASAHGIRETTAMATGYPRNDTLFKDLDGERLGPNSETYERFESLAESGTVVTYLPTYRSGFGNDDGQIFDEKKMNLRALDDLLKRENAHFLMKFHPSSTVDIDAERFDRIEVLPVDFDVYPALEYVDVLVTDYSSIFFDYLLLDRPLVFYPYDLESYRSNRGFYFSYDEITPGPTATNPTELNDRLERCLNGDDGYAERRECVRNTFYEHADGDSAERVCEYVEENYIDGR